MPQENVEVILQGVEAFNRQDADAVVAIASPDVNGKTPSFGRGLPGSIGGERLREWFNQVLEPWESFHFEVEEITEAADDRVFLVGVGLLTTRGKGGVEAPGLRSWSVFWIADGKVTRRQVFLDRDEALEAAGLSE